MTLDADVNLTDDVPTLEALETERDEIVGHIQSIDAQLVTRKGELETYQSACYAMGPQGKQAYLDALNEYNQWRSKAIGAKRHRVRELQDVKAQIKAANSRTSATQSTRRYQNLRRAVAAHQEAVMEGGYEATPADEELWSILHDHVRLDDDTHG